MAYATPASRTVTAVPEYSGQEQLVAGIVPVVVLPPVPQPQPGPFSVSPTSVTLGGTTAANGAPTAAPALNIGTFSLAD